MTKKKSFIDELKEHKKKTASKRRGVVAVVAHREEIEQGIEAGFTLNDIYTVLAEKGQMPVSYSAFVKLVRKYVREKDQIQVPAKGNKKNGVTGSKRKSGIYDPDDIDIDDLI